jgi:hypothetical protein
MWKKQANARSNICLSSGTSENPPLKGICEPDKKTQVLFSSTKNAGGRQRGNTFGWPGNVHNR